MIRNKNEKVVSRIARKIRSTRLEKKLTIQQLALRTKVSKGLLSKIENSRTIPSLPVFVTLIESLDISLKEFFDDIALFNGKGYLLVKHNEHTPIDLDNTGFSSSHILSQHIGGRTMQTVLINVEPGRQGSPSGSDGFTLNYIVKGAFEYHINNEVVALEEGDAIYLEGSLLHIMINKSRRKASVLAIQFDLLK
jgi:transcriptional regulator with XRE-family HTH domain